MDLSRSIRRRLVVASLTVVSCIGSAQRGASAAETVRHVYDVTDLVNPAPDFSDAPKLGVASANDRHAAPAKTKSARENGQELATWLSNGLRVAGIEASELKLEGEDRLDVKGSDAAHLRITKLLEAARAERSAQVVIEARQFVIGSDLKPLAAQDAGAADALLASMAPNRPAVELDEAASDRLITAIQAGRDTSLMSAPRVTVFNRQHAYVQVSSQQAFIAGFGESVVNGKPQVTPQIDVVATGTVLGVQPVADAARKTVALDVHYQCARLLEMKSEKRPGPDGQPADVQVPVVESHDIDRPLLMPQAGSVLLYLGHAEASKEQGKANSDAGEMFVLLKANVVEGQKAGR